MNGLRIKWLHDQRPAMIAIHTISTPPESYDEGPASRHGSHVVGQALADWSARTEFLLRMASQNFLLSDSHDLLPRERKCSPFHSAAGPLHSDCETLQVRDADPPFRSTARFSFSISSPGPAGPGRRGEGRRRARCHRSGRFCLCQFVMIKPPQLARQFSIITMTVSCRSIVPELSSTPQILRPCFPKVKLSSWGMFQNLEALPLKTEPPGCSTGGLR